MLGDAEVQVTDTDNEVSKISASVMTLERHVAQATHVASGTEELNGAGGEELAMQLGLEKLPQISTENKGLEQTKQLLCAALKKQAIAKRENAEARKASLAGGLVLKSIAQAKFKVGKRASPGAPFVQLDLHLVCVKGQLRRHVWKKLKKHQKKSHSLLRTRRRYRKQNLLRLPQWILRTDTLRTTYI